MSTRSIYRVKIHLQGFPWVSFYENVPTKDDILAAMKIYIGDDNSPMAKSIQSAIEHDVRTTDIGSLWCEQIIHAN